MLAFFAVTPCHRRLRAAEILTSLGKAEPTTADRGLVETDVSLPSGEGAIRARIYRRAGGRGPGIVVAHGVHYRGIDEKRLVRFSRELAASGAVVLTPELGELADYRITAQGVRVIDASVHWLSGREELVVSPRVGLVGFSFAGGLSLVASTKPEVQSRLAYVASIGGHHDLERVLGFLLHDTVATPTGVVHTKAHEYGLVVLLYQELEHVVDAEDQDVLRAALRAWLHEEKREAVSIAAGCRTESCRHTFELLEKGRLAELRPALEGRVRARGAELGALSPHGHLGEIHVPIYALHGAGDTVIPPSETAWIEREAAERHREHLTLVSPLIEHVELAHHASLGDEWALVDFMAHLL